LIFSGARGSTNFGDCFFFDKSIPSGVSLVTDSSKKLISVGSRGLLIENYDNNLPFGLNGLASALAANLSLTPS
jgi:hypothetical protein